MPSRILFFLCFLFLVILPSLSQVPDSVEQDLRDQWLIYNQSLETYAPFVNQSSYSGNNISFVLNRETNKNENLIICFQEGSSLFIEQQIVGFYQGKDCPVFDLDSLFAQYNQPDIFFTIYNKTLDLDKIETFVASKFNLTDEEIASRGQYLMMREGQGFKNFYILALIIFLGLLSFAYNLNPKSFRQFWSISKIVDFNLSYDKIHGLRIMTWSNLLVIFVHCMLVSYLLIVVFHLMGDPLAFLKTNINATIMGLGKWVSLSIGVFALVFLKYFVIKLLATMMQLREVDNVHFFEFIRISIFIYTLALLLVMIYVLGFYQPKADHLVWIIYLVAILSLVRIILLYFKFLRLTTFRNFYLFSYLCTTEILPFIIGLKIFVLRFIG